MENVKEIISIPNNLVLKTHLKELYIIDDYMRTFETYEKFQDSLYRIICGCFEHKDCREYPVKFKFYARDTETYTLEFRHFITNVFLWYPLVNLYGTGGILTKDIILDCNTQIPMLTDFQNVNIIHVLQDCGVNNVKINRSVSKSLHKLRSISTDFAVIMNLSIGLKSFLDIYESSARMKSIMETQFPDGMQPSEIEDELNKLQIEALELIKKLPNNAVATILKSGTGIKHKQLVEYMICLGLKPDLSGATIPKVINSNTLIGGLQTPADYFIDATGARKSAIMAQTVMGNAGYFGKLLLLLSTTLTLSKTVSDCNTPHFLEIYIKNKKMLQRYNARYYKDVDGQLKVLRTKKCKHLIGTTVRFRSPITCACSNDEICHKCFGLTSLLNLDILDGVSGFESEEITKVVNQLILSAKHLLSTISERIEFNDDFYRFFSVLSGEITPLLSEENVDEFDIYIDPNKIEKVEEFDDDSSSNSYVNGKFQIINRNTGEVIDIISMTKGECVDRELYITDELLQLIKKGNGYVSFKDLTEETLLFRIIILNNELTKPLYDLMALLKTQKYNLEAREDYHKFSQKLTELLVDGGIGAMAIAGEIIVNRLLRTDPDTEYRRPDFSRKHLEKYSIKTIIQALTQNKSAMIGLASQGIKNQLLSSDISFRNGESYLDSLFKEVYIIED